MEENKNIREIIAKNLANLRKNKKMTQSELAEKFGYSDKAVSKWENGDTLPDVETLYKLCEFYNISLDFLINEESFENKIQYVNKMNRTVILNNNNHNTCQGSTWMAHNTNWWMLTPRTLISAVFFLDEDGTFYTNTPNDDSYNAVGVRGFYTLYLSADVKIKGGNGSYNNPYTLG